MANKSKKLPTGSYEIRLRRLQDAIMWVRDSLSPGKHIPIMSHIWFRKDSVMTYCEATGQSVPCKVGFEAAVRGSLLTAILQDIEPKKDEMATFEFRDDNVLVSIRKGKTKASFPILPRSKFVFDFPEIGDKPTTTIKRRASFAAALEFAMLGADPFAGVPDFMDVILYQHKGKTIALSLNGANLARAVLPQKLDGISDEPTLIPHVFCKRFVEMLTQPGFKEDEIKVTVHDEGLLVTTTKSNYKLFGAHRKLSQRREFEAELKKDLGNKEPEYIEVPESFANFARRSNALLQEGQSAQRIIYDDFTRVRLKDNGLRCVTETPLGRVVDEHEFSAGKYSKLGWAVRADVSSLLKVLGIPKDKNYKLEMAALPSAKLVAFKMGPDRLFLSAQRAKPKSN